MCLCWCEEPVNMARLQVEVSPGIFGCDASALGRRGNHDGTRHKMCWAMTSAGKMRDRPSKPAKCTYRKIIRIRMLKSRCYQFPRISLLLVVSLHFQAPAPPQIRCFLKAAHCALLFCIGSQHLCELSPLLNKYVITNGSICITHCPLESTTIAPPFFLSF